MTRATFKNEIFQSQINIGGIPAPLEFNMSTLT
jgi:hypothetical protein